MASPPELQRMESSVALTQAAGIEDMITMDRLTEESIHDNIKTRYQSNLIYTYVGNILIAVNPYEVLPIFTLNVVKTYHETPIDKKTPPHIFAIARAAHHNLVETNKSQSILISGESGAGKTESTKLVLQYLASMSGKQSKIQQEILEANPILEAFGNAKTIRNNNSSRFGKFIGIHFNNEHNIIGANVVQYLLEKSRIVHQAANERNYHVFYQLCAGADEEEKEKWKLGEAKDYPYLNQGNCFSIDGVDDEEEFEILRNALSCLDIHDDDQDTIFGILAAILHLGCVKFKGSDETVEVENPEKLDVIAELLSLDPAELKKSLIERTIEVNKQKTVIPLKPSEAPDNRDALSKALYGRLFQWLVQQINVALAKETSKTFIGILDIYGFENFQVNSFEQFCINYANEKLQQHFNQAVFKLEQEEYKKEGINWSAIDFIDNQDVLDLIEKKLGILSILDEECRFPKATDDTFLKKVNDNHSKNSFYEIPKLSKTSFAIKHYAGSVPYEVSGFLDKNKHTLQQDLVNLCLGSKSPLVAALFKEENEDEDLSLGTLRKGPKAVTVGSQFKKQLEELMKTLSMTEPHFVRCIKPNAVQAAKNFDTSLVQEQLRYLGMLETVKIRQMGYATRFTFAEFCERFQCLGKSGATKDKTADCEKLLQDLSLPQGQWEKGTSKVFLKTDLHRQLEVQREIKIREKVIVIQAAWRMASRRKYYQNLKKSTTILQALTRKKIARKLYLRLYDAVVVLQSFARMIKEKNEYQKLKLAVHIQTAYRALACRKVFGELLEEKRKKEEEERKRREEEERRRQEEERKRREEEERRFQEEQKRLAEEERKRREEERRKQEEERKRKEEEERRLAEEKKKEEEERQRQELERRRAEEEQRIREQEEKIRKAREEKIRKQIEERDAKEAARRAALTDEEIDSDFSEQNKAVRRAAKLKKQLSMSEIRTSRRSGEFSTLDKSTLRRGTLKSQKLNVSSVQSLRTTKRHTRLGPFDKLAEKDLGSRMKTLRDYGAIQTPIFVAYRRNAIGERLIDLKNKKAGIEVTIPEIISPEEAPEYVFYNFAKRNYQNQSKGTLRKRTVGASELMLYSRSKLRTSLLKLGPDDSRLAPVVWEAILTYMGVSKLNTSTPINQAAEAVIYAGLNNIQLRNEIYCQVTRQLTNNPSEIALKRAWDLMCFICSTFPPNHYLLKYVASFLMGRTLDKSSPHSETAKYCMERLKRTVYYGARNLVPCEAELEAIKNMEPLPITVTFMDGFQLNINIDPETVVAEVFSQCIKSVGLQSGSQFALYEISNELERSLSDEENLCDLISKWDQYKKMVAAKGLDSESWEFNFFMKKQMYLNPEEDSTDPVEFDLVFHQAIHSILRGWWCTDEKTALKLSAIQWCYEAEDMEPAVPQANQEFIELTEQYIPRSIYHLHKPEEWANLIIKEIPNYHKTDKDALQHVYMNEVKKLPLYGSTVFPVSHKTKWSLPEAFEIAIDRKGIQFVKQDSKEILTNYSYSQIVKWDHDANVLRIEFDESAGNSVLAVQTIQGEEMVHLIRQYSDEINKKGKAKFARAKVDQNFAESSTWDPRLLLSFKKGDIIEIEDYLDDNWMVGFISDKKGMFSADKVTLLAEDPRKIASSQKSLAPTAKSDEDVPKVSIELRRQTIRNTSDDIKKYQLKNLYVFQEIYRKKTKKEKEFFDVDVRLKYQKDPIQLSMLNILDDELNKIACEMFINVMRYMDEIPSQVETVLLAQDLIQTAIDKPTLRDELFLQICKQTSGNPNRLHSTKGWELLTLAVGCFAPSDEVFPYIEHYFLENSADETAIGHFACDALDRLRKTKKKNVIRQKSPSELEIEAVKNHSPLIIQIGYADYWLDKPTIKKIKCDSSTTVDEAIVKLVKHIGLANDAGYSLFETLDVGYEYPLQGELFFADFLRNLEPKYGRKKLRSKDFKFWQVIIFKKKLNYAVMETPTDPAELDLAYAEAVSTVLQNKFPVTEELATNLAALQLQIRFGDHNPSDENLTSKNLDQYVPSQLLESLNLSVSKEKKWIETIKLCWVALSGTGATEAKNIYLGHMKEWPYYGSSLFAVEQRRKPKKAIIAINKDGLSVLNCASNKKEVAYQFKWPQIASWREDEDKFIITAGPLVKPIRLSFSTKHSHVINTIFEEYLNLMVEMEEKHKPAPPTAVERIKEVRARRGTVTKTIGGEKARPPSVRYEFNFDDVKAANAELEENEAFNPAVGRKAGHGIFSDFNFQELEKQLKGTQ